MLVAYRRKEGAVEGGYTRGIVQINRNMPKDHRYRRTKFCSLSTQSGSALDFTPQLRTKLVLNLLHLAVPWRAGKSKRQRITATKVYGNDLQRPRFQTFVLTANRFIVRTEKTASSVIRGQCEWPF